MQPRTAPSFPARLVLAFCLSALPGLVAQAQRPPRPYETSHPAPRAVPSAAQLQQAAKTVDDVFGAEAAVKARKPAERAEIARGMLKEAAKEASAPAADHAVRYVLLSRARDFAASGGDMDTTRTALDTLAASFKVDLPRLRFEAFKTLGEAPARDRDLIMLLYMLQDAAAEVLAADQFDFAAQHADVAVAAARKGGAPADLIAAAAARQRELREIASASAALQKITEAPGADPKNSEPNAARGRFNCLLLGNWKRGLPLLAAGNNAPLKAAAQKELAASSAAARAAVAADWLALSKRENGPPRNQVLLHAMDLYQQAVGEAKGLEKRRIENDLAKAAAAFPPELRGETAQTVDVLAHVTPLRYRTQGNVVADENSVRCGPEQYSGLTTTEPVPVPFKAKFELETDARILQLACGAASITLCSGDPDTGDYNALRMHDGAAEDYREFPGKGTLPQNQLIRIDLRITAHTLEILVNNEFRGRLLGDYSKMSDQLRFVIPGKGTVELKTFKLTPLR